MHLRVSLRSSWRQLKTFLSFPFITRIMNYDHAVGRLGGWATGWLTGRPAFRLAISGASLVMQACCTQFYRAWQFSILLCRSAAHTTLASFFRCGKYNYIKYIPRRTRTFACGCTRCGMQPVATCYKQTNVCMHLATVWACARPLLVNFYGLWKKQANRVIKRQWKV